MGSAIKLWSFLLLLSLVCALSDADAEYESSARFPQGQAERMIKALNLIPGAMSDESSGDQLLDQGASRLQERRIKLDIGGDPGITTEDLGQYAGYFKLARTHAAQ